jgi:hypothetical protein
MNVMTIMISVIALALLATFFLALRSHAQQLHSLEDFKKKWHPLDIEAFANLLDPMEERYLQQNLSSSEFRRISRERLLVTNHYLGRIASNAKLMVQAGQIIQQHNSGEEAIRARQHVQSAMHLRMVVFFAQCAVLGKLVMPQLSTPLQSVLSKYGQVAHSFDNVLDSSLVTAKM